MILLASLWVLAGCAADLPREATTDIAPEGEGPRIYGQLGVSVDHVDTR
jgi:hypothetical protein